MSHRQQDFDQRIRESGFRLTPQRQLILDAICALGDHATVQEIYERVRTVAPAINRATVYRALGFFCDLRLLVSAEIAGSTVYEIAEPTPHHHLVCRRCGGTQELADRHFDELAEHLLAEHDFAAEIDHMTIPGICADCRDSNSGE